MALVSLMAMRLLLIDASSLLAAPLEPKEVPAPLKPWIPWVLHGKEREGCPFLYHRGDQHRCAWPATLKITVDNISIAGEKNPIIGRAIVIHAKVDDGGQPTGNAGARQGFGVIGIAKPK